MSNLPNQFLSDPLSLLGLQSHQDDIIGRVNWLIADFNERHRENPADDNGNPKNSPPEEAVQQLKAKIALYATNIEDQCNGGCGPHIRDVIDDLRQLSAV